MVHLSPRSPMWSSTMTTHVCTPAELLTREIREEGGDGKIEGDGGREGWGGGRRRRWRFEGSTECVSEDERCGDVVGRWEVRWEVREEVGEWWRKGERRHRMKSGQWKDKPLKLWLVIISDCVPQVLCCCFFSSSVRNGSGTGESIMGPLI